MSGATFQILAALGFTPPATSYANSGGTGNRTGIISVSSTGLTFGGGAFSNAIIDGTGGTSGTGVFWLNTGAQTGSITFDFGVGKYIDEWKLICQNAGGGMGVGPWIWSGSNDNVSYTNLKTNVDLSANSTNTVTIAPYGARYLYYRLSLAGGTAAGGWVYEFEFKIG